MFYVMPNYLTVDGQSQVAPVSWKDKSWRKGESNSNAMREWIKMNWVFGRRQLERRLRGSKTPMGIL